MRFLLYRPTFLWMASVNSVDLTRSFYGWHYTSLSEARPRSPLIRGISTPQWPLTLAFIFFGIAHKLSDPPTVMKGVNFQLRPPDSFWLAAWRRNTPNEFHRPLPSGLSSISASPGIARSKINIPSRRRLNHQGYLFGCNK
jgi:hypothetical protein